MTPAPLLHVFGDISQTDPWAVLSNGEESWTISELLAATRRNERKLPELRRKAFSWSREEGRIVVYVNGVEIFREMQ